MEEGLPGDQRDGVPHGKCRGGDLKVLAAHRQGRAGTPFSRNARRIRRKQGKITDEDWRNREKWDEYETAVNEMLVRTSQRTRRGSWWKATANIMPG